MHYFPPLDKELQPGPPMPQRESMRRLNDARNALKHKGLRADRADLEHHTEAVIRFFDEATPRIFGADIDSVSLVAVVRCESAQPYLQAAELAYREDRAADGSPACAEALHEVLNDYEQRQSDRGLESPFSPRHRLRTPWFMEEESRQGRKLREHIEALNETVIELHERTRLLSLGVDYRRYARFQRLTPRVHVLAKSRRVLVNPPDITMDELRFCIDFVIDTALCYPSRTPSGATDPGLPRRSGLRAGASAGKTIMTGLYLREVLARRLIRRVLVVPPAGATR